MIDFPNQPTVGQIVEAPNGQQWTWNGSTWLMVGSLSGGGTQSIEVGPAVGTISAWATDQAIPPDCLVCDGAAIPAGTAYDRLRSLYGTNVPDLRDKFLVGASATKAAKSVGGAETHILTPGEMPSHTHIQDAHQHTFNYQGSPGDFPFTDGFNPAGGIKFAVGTNSYGSVGIYPTTPTNQYTGGNGAHNNMPPYYAVVWIIQARATTRTVFAAAATGGGDGSSGFTYVSDVMPLPTKANETWFNTSAAVGGGASYVAVDEGGGSLVWVQFAPGATGAQGPQGPPGIATREAGSWTTRYEGASTAWANGADVLVLPVPVIVDHRYLILMRAECLESTYAGGRMVGVVAAIYGYYQYGTAAFPSVQGNTMPNEVVYTRTWVSNMTGSLSFAMRAYNHAGGNVWFTGGPYGGGPELTVIDVTYL